MASGGQSSTIPAMHTWVYKGNRKADTYLYLTGKEAFDRVPDSLLNLLGELSLVISFDLSEKERLAQVDIDSVRQKLSEDGYFLQLPPGDPRDQTPC